MSEFTNTYEARVEMLSSYLLGLLVGARGSSLLQKYKITDTSFTALDVMMALENVIARGVDMEALKPASSKLFNLLYKDLSGQEKPEYPQGSMITYLIRDNDGIRNHLANTRKSIKQINQEVTSHTLASLLKDFVLIRQFAEHYIVMQNIVFSEIEKHVKEHKCLSLMWAFHDDVSKYIRLTIDELQKENFDLVRFNVLSSKVFFNISTLFFREENVLFPVMQKTLHTSSDTKMLLQLKDFKLAFADTSDIQTEPGEVKDNPTLMDQDDIKLSTGALSIEQLEAIFSTLPVDITFVNKADEVRYFSSPDHRIFPRTTGIIGRKVQNCHPHESVHVVNQIVESFKKGEQSEASFWIKMGPKYVLIKYFALKDKDHAYIGTLEVSQEISEIQSLKGERRLLDW